MIISASRRTDIPAFFSEWIINRLKEQYAYVRNPMNIHQVSKINLSPDVVDCIVFNLHLTPMIKISKKIFLLCLQELILSRHYPIILEKNVSYGVMIPLSLTKNTLLIGTLKDSNTLQNNSVFIQKK